MFSITKIGLKKITILNLKKMSSLVTTKKKKKFSVLSYKFINFILEVEIYCLIIRNSIAYRTTENNQPTNPFINIGFRSIIFSIEIKMYLSLNKIIQCSMKNKICKICSVVEKNPKYPNI